MKRVISLLGAGVAVLVWMGCASTEEPNYQGKRGTSPTVNEYYPGPASTNDWRATGR